MEKEKIKLEPHQVEKLDSLDTVAFGLLLDAPSRSFVYSVYTLFTTLLRAPAYLANTMRTMNLGSQRVIRETAQAVSDAMSALISRLFVRHIHEMDVVTADAGEAAKIGLFNLIRLRISGCLAIARERNGYETLVDWLVSFHNIRACAMDFELIERVVGRTFDLKGKEVFIWPDPDEMTDRLVGEVPDDELYDFMQKYRMLIILLAQETDVTVVIASGSNYRDENDEHPWWSCGYEIGPVGINTADYLPVGEDLFYPFDRGTNRLQYWSTLLADSTSRIIDGYVSPVGLDLFIKAGLAQNLHVLLADILSLPGMANVCAYVRDSGPCNNPGDLGIPVISAASVVSIGKEMKKDSSRGYLPWPFVQRPDGLREWGTPLNDLNLIAFETSGSHVRYFGDHFWRMHAEEGHQISMLLSLALQSYTTLWGDSMMIRHIAETMNWDDNEEFRTFIMAYVSRVVEADARFQARVEGITRFMAGKLIAHFQSRVENSVAFAEKGIDILHQYEEVVGDVSNWEPTMASRLLAICVDREASLAGLSDDDAVEAELLGEEE